MSYYSLSFSARIWCAIAGWTGGSVIVCTLFGKSGWIINAGIGSFVLFVFWLFNRNDLVVSSDEDEET